MCRKIIEDVWRLEWEWYHYQDITMRASLGPTYRREDRLVYSNAKRVLDQIVSIDLFRSGLT